MVVPSTQPYQGCVGNDRCLRGLHALPSSIIALTVRAIIKKGSESFFLSGITHSRRSALFLVSLAVGSGKPRTCLVFVLRTAEPISHRLRFYKDILPNSQI